MLMKRKIFKRGQKKKKKKKKKRQCRADRRCKWLKPLPKDRKDAIEALNSKALTEKNEETRPSQAEVKLSQAAGVIGWRNRDN
jgi:hypothetical protein